MSYNHLKNLLKSLQLTSDYADERGTPLLLFEEPSPKKPFLSYGGVNSNPNPASHIINNTLRLAIVNQFEARVECNIIEDLLPCELYKPLIQPITKYYERNKFCKIIEDTPNNMKTAKFKSANDILISANEIYENRFSEEFKSSSGLQFSVKNCDMDSMVDAHHSFSESFIQSAQHQKCLVLVSSSEEDSNFVSLVTTGNLENGQKIAFASFIVEKQAIYSIFLSDSDVCHLPYELKNHFENTIRTEKTDDERFFMIGKDSYSGYVLKPFTVNKKYEDSFIETHFNEDFDQVHNAICQLFNDGMGLVLLHGMPGTGKTNYLQYMMGYPEKRKVVYLPTYMIDSLVDPSFIDFLSEELSGSILVIEDAESAITSREGHDSNKNAVSNILNLTDGFLAQSLGILVVCTFNTDLKFVDQALLRAGRLKVRYEFTDLQTDRANALLQSMGKLPTHQPMTLADIYNKKVEVIHEPKKLPFGFGKQ